MKTHSSQAGRVGAIALIACLFIHSLHGQTITVSGLGIPPSAGGTTWAFNYSDIAYVQYDGWGTNHYNQPDGSGGNYIYYQRTNDGKYLGTGSEPYTGDFIGNIHVDASGNLAGTSIPWDGSFPDFPDSGFMAPETSTVTAATPGSLTISGQDSSFLLTPAGTEVVTLQVTGKSGAGSFGGGAPLGVPLNLGVLNYTSADPAFSAFVLTTASTAATNLYGLNAQAAAGGSYSYTFTTTIDVPTTFTLHYFTPPSFYNSETMSVTVLSSAPVSVPVTGTLVAVDGTGHAESMAQAGTDVYLKWTIDF